MFFPYIVATQNGQYFFQLRRKYFQNYKIDPRFRKNLHPVHLNKLRFAHFNVRHWNIIFGEKKSIFFELQKISAAAKYAILHVFYFHSYICDDWTSIKMKWKLSDKLLVFQYFCLLECDLLNWNGFYLLCKSSNFYFIADVLTKSSEVIHSKISFSAINRKRGRLLTD
jgi:hypothetical protein